LSVINLQFPRNIKRHLGRTSRPACISD